MRKMAWEVFGAINNIVLTFVVFGIFGFGLMLVAGIVASFTSKGV